MKSGIRLLILSTFLLPPVFIGGWWLVRHFSSPELILNNSNYKINKTESKLVAVDGANIPYTLLQIRKTPQDFQKSKILILVSDLNRDRNWQSKGISPAIGKYIAQLISNLGYDSIRFDMRGTGDNNASKNSQTNPALHLKDLQSIHKHLLKTGYSRNNIWLLAHGEYGCMLALSAATQSIKPASLLLLNCAAQGTYLETWGSLLFDKMKQGGVPERLIAGLQPEWQQFIYNGTIKTNSKDTLPDVQAFRNTLRYLLKDENRDLYQMARHTNLDQKIRQIIEQGQSIHHFVSENDANTNEALQKQLRERAVKLNSKFYTFKLIKASDYYLRQSNSNTNHFLATILKNLNPKTRLAADFQRQLVEVLKIQ